jgi:tRNA dimethylallyltransferase
VLIAGPTASGKSAAALEIARRTGGAVINCDAMQVYAELSVLTARPDRETLASAEHLLYGHVPAATAWSVAKWLDEARATYFKLRAEGRVAIFAGGTGLYFKALEGGLSEMPPPDPAIREHWRQVAENDPAALHEALLQRDARAAARLGSSDRQRLVRALEMHDSTGRSIVDLQSSSGSGIFFADIQVARFILDPPREQLHAAINARTLAMIGQGAVQEVENLVALDLAADLPAMKAIGVVQITAHLAQNAPLEETIGKIQAATRQYAKRQSTWFRNQTGPDWQRKKSAKEIIATVC